MRRLKDCCEMVVVLYRGAEPLYASGRMVDHMPVVKRIRGLRSVSKDMYEVHVPVWVN